MYEDATLPLMVDIGSGKSLFTSFDIESALSFIACLVVENLRFRAISCSNVFIASRRFGLAFPVRGI